MTPRQRCLAIMAEVGAEFDDYGGPGTLKGGAYTPAGLVWKASGVHTLAINFSTDRQRGWMALLVDLGEGTQACREIDCEVCHEPCSDSLHLLCRN